MNCRRRLGPKSSTTEVKAEQHLERMLHFGAGHREGAKSAGPSRSEVGGSAGNSRAETTAVAMRRPCLIRRRLNKTALMAKPRAPTD